MSVVGYIFVHVGIKDTLTRSICTFNTTNHRFYSYWYDSRLPEDDRDFPDCDWVKLKIKRRL